MSKLGCLLGVVGLGLLPALADEAQTASESGAPETVIVTGVRVKLKDATGLSLTLRETPQSVTVIGQKQIQDFNLSSINDLLEQVTGVNVERVETDRTVYDSRGFDITNFQVDGLGLPLSFGIQYGDLDTAIFDHVEVLRGANGMMTGTGNPSATVNYVRKRPLADFAATVEATYGSWDDYRLEGDVTGPLNEAGNLTGRLVYANEDTGSYLDFYTRNRNVFYGILSYDVTPKLNLTSGYSWQDNRSQGVMWGALPLNYADGSYIDYLVSASTSAPWTFWDVRSQSAFGEASYRFDNNWTLKGVATYNRTDQMAQLLYAFGYPDRATGLGVFGVTGIYPSVNQKYIYDLTANGPFSLFGRAHELVVGANYSTAHDLEWENFPTRRWSMGRSAPGAASPCPNRAIPAPISPPTRRTSSPGFMPRPISTSPTI